MNHTDTPDFSQVIAQGERDLAALQASPPDEEDLADVIAQGERDSADLQANAPEEQDLAGVVARGEQDLAALQADVDDDAAGRDRVAHLGHPPADEVVEDP